VSSLPEIPTVAESGLPGFEGLLYYALIAPARTPQDIIKKLNDAVRQVKQNPEVARQIERVGAIAFDMTPQELGVTLQRDLDKWTKVIQSAGIQPE
jgi:tripartite-type tricarboxylate transporter receptor subunit TctC